MTHHKIEARIESIVDLSRRRREINLTDGITALAVGCCILSLVASFQPVGFVSTDSQATARSIPTLAGERDHFHEPIVVVDTSRTIVDRSSAAATRVNTAKDEKRRVPTGNLGRQPGLVGFSGNAEVLTDDSSVHAFREADTVEAITREEDSMRTKARVDQAAVWPKQKGINMAKERGAGSDWDMANSYRAMAKADEENSRRREEQTKHPLEGDPQ